MAKKENLNELKTHVYELINSGELEKNKSLITSKFNEMMSLVYASMAYARDNNTFFLYFLSKLEKEIDYELEAPAAVYITNGSYHLVLNPVMLVGFKIKEIKAVVIHEVYHIINNHIRREIENSDKYNYDHEVGNIAMDAAINQYIPNLPKGTVTLNMINNQFKIYSEIKSNQEWEYYYNLIIKSDGYKDWKQDKQNKIQKLKDLFNELSNALNSGGGNGNGDGKENSDSNNQNIEDIVNKIREFIKENNIVINPNITVNKSDQTDAFNNDIVKDLINHALQQSKGRGTVPGGIIEALNRLSKKPQIKWQDILKSIIPSIKCPYKKVQRVRNRLQPTRYDLNGKVSDKKNNILVAIDTSGSMSDKMIKNSLKEVLGIIKSAGIQPKITVVECDAKINKIYEVEKESDIQLKISGRGGTQFQPVFEYIYNCKRKNTENFDILIYFTDGYGEYEIPLKYKPDCQVMWVINTNNNGIYLSLRNPFCKKQFIKPLFPQNN
jgi:predicted metal-dependent peptidase